MAPKKGAKPEKAPAAASNIQEEKLKALEHALADLDKQYGKGAVMKLSSDGVLRDIPVISTGCLTLDYALGVGGIPRGRIVEIYGPESSGKTTVALHIVAEAQKAADEAVAAANSKAEELGKQVEELTAQAEAAAKTAAEELEKAKAGREY